MNEERIDHSDSKVHKLDGSHHSDVILLLGREDRRFIHPAWKILRKRKFGALSPFLCDPGKSSGQNWISHPHWVKICDDHNTKINLRAKQKYKVLSAIQRRTRYELEEVPNFLKLIRCYIYANLAMILIKIFFFYWWLGFNHFWMFKSIFFYRHLQQRRRSF